MSKIKYSRFHTTIQKVASSRPGAWFFSLTQHHFDRIVLRLTNHKATLTSVLSGLPVVILTTKGAKSGLPRTVPLLCVQDESGSGKVALIASNWGQKHHPGWYYNLTANPQASCEIKGETGEYTAHEAEGDEYDYYWQAAMDTYLGFPEYQKRVGSRHIPIMVLTAIEV